MPPSIFLMLERNLGKKIRVILDPAYGFEGTLAAVTHEPSGIWLSDAEAVDAADKFDQLPAARGFLETLLIIAFLVFLILLITDIAGYTDVFPFVHPKK